MTCFLLRTCRRYSRLFREKKKGSTKGSWKPLNGERPVILDLPLKHVVKNSLFDYELRCRLVKGPGETGSKKELFADCGAKEKSSQLQKDLGEIAFPHLTEIVLTEKDAELVMVPLGYQWLVARTPLSFFVQENKNLY